MSPYGGSFFNLKIHRFSLDLECHFVYIFIMAEGPVTRKGNQNGTVYAPTARFDITRGMTEDEMRKIAPSIFATEAHESRSDRFVPVPTIEVLRGLKKEGFDVVGVKQSNTRDEGKRNFTKHLIRLRRVDGEKYKVGDTVAEMLLKNANDGTCQYELMAGLFRILCLNSLVAQKAEIESIKVRHSGNHQETITKVIEGTFRVVDEAEFALEAPKQWSRIDLNSDEKQIFAESVHESALARRNRGLGRLFSRSSCSSPVVSKTTATTFGGCSTSLRNM